jgi:coenzyme F420-reducing hydrogenase alpha subunit
MGIDISEQTLLLRKILCDGATLQSHILHVYFLVAPDLFGVPSVIPLARTAPEVVKRALRLKKLANDICDVIGGRAVHPITMVPGGVTKVPEATELKALRQRLVEGADDILATVETLKSVADKIPSFERETEYISLRSRDDEYALYDGDICSSDTGTTPDKNYLQMTNEKVVAHSTAKHTHANRGSYMVGALARCNNNADRFNGTAQKAADELGLEPMAHNPYLNSIAQVVECGLIVERVVGFVDRLLEIGPKQEPRRSIKPRAGRGIGCTEVPRGILYHDYTYNDNGVIVEANCIIPTNQNFANIDLDMQALVPQLVEAGKTQEEITFALEMLVRAYDPCISCSVHLLDVQFLG